MFLVWCGEFIFLMVCISEMIVYAAHFPPDHFNTVLGRQRTAKNKTAAWLHLKLPVVVPLSPLVRLYSEANPSTCMDNLLSDFQHLNAGKSIRCAPLMTSHSFGITGWAS